jgi:hypothetical protein
MQNSKFYILNLNYHCTRPGWVGSFMTTVLKHSQDIGMETGILL